MVKVYLIKFSGRHFAESKEVDKLVKQQFGAKARVVRTSSGKPVICGKEKAFLSLSHTCGIGAVCLADVEVGVDIEKLRTPPKRLAKKLLESDEKKFFTKWTRIEAMQKIDELPLKAALERPTDDGQYQFITKRFGAFLLSVATKKDEQCRKTENIQIVDKIVDSVDNF